MLDATFREAFCHQAGGHTILDRKLHPFCAFDCLSLEAIASPLLHDGAECAIPDLAIALWICSNPTPDDLSIGNLELGPEGEVWFSGIIKDVNLVRDTLLFARYVKDYFSLPEIMSEVAKRPITELGAPWMLSTVCMVCNRLNLSLRDAWTMGIGQLIWYRAGITELETDSRIVSPELRDEMAKAKTGSKKFAMEPGETLDQFSERIGISAQEAAILLHGRPVHG